MLKIRREQFEAFSPQNDDEIIEFILGHLEEYCPELIEGISPEYIREMVANGVKRARKYDLRTLADLTGFVAIMFEIAPNFDEVPELHSVLTDENIPQDERFSRLFDSKYDEAWDKADNLDDDEARAEAWFPELKDDKE